MRNFLARGSSLLVVVVVLAIAPIASALTMEWTAVGNPDNAPDDTGYGAVGYTYSIGTYEVTNFEYAEFLNAKAAASDPLQLWNTSMDIVRSGAPGSYTYSPDSFRDEKPVRYVSFADALRFANWMSNGQGGGDTETGSYTLLGGTPTPTNLATVTRSASAAIALPSEDEWYKAAYYTPTLTTYYAYPANFNGATGCAAPTGTANRANCNLALNDLANKGSYGGSASPYGTFDQGGNVSEWNEAIIGDGHRGVRGGSYADLSSALSSGTREDLDPTTENGRTGFRLALVPEPSTGPLVIAGLLALARRRAR